MGEDTDVFVAAEGSCGQLLMEIGPARIVIADETDVW